MASIAPYDRARDRTLDLTPLPRTIARHLRDVDESWWPLIRICVAFFLLGALAAAALILEGLAW